MNNSAFPLAFGVVKPAEYLTDETLSVAKSYRDAVKLCWICRRSKGMTQRQLAELADLYPSHVSDYLKDGDLERNLPAEKISAFEEACGNRAISQWEARQRGFTIMEEVIARRAA